MRPIRLARVAAEAEVLRLRRKARRTAIRAALGAVAAVFAIAALGFAHVAVFLAVAHRLDPTSAALIVLGGDLLIALILALLASRSKPDAIELEALQVREQAVEQLEDIIATAALAAPLARMVGRPRILGVMLVLILPRLLAYFRR